MALNLGELYLTAKADFSQVRNETKKTESEIGKMESIISKFSGAAAVGMAAVGVAFGAAAVKSVKLAADMEQSKIAFNTMLGSAAESEKMLKKLYNFAAKTPFEFPEISAAAKSLLAFGESAETIPTTLKRIGDVSSGIGAPLGEIATIYGKIRVQGRLFAEDMNQLTGRGIPVIQELAKQFHTTDSEVKKLVESGKIGFPQIEEAFRSLTSEGGKFYNMMESQSESMSGLWSTFKDNVNMALAEVGQNIIDTFDLKNKLKGAIDVIGNLTKWFIDLPAPIKSAAIAFVGVSTALIAVVAGVSALTMALGALQISFAPLLIGGAIIAGIVMIGESFKIMAENARIAKMEIANINEISDAVKKREAIKNELTRYEEMQKAAKGGDTKNGWLAGGIGSFSKEDEGTLSQLRYQFGEVNAQIEKLKKSAEVKTPETPETPGTVSSAFDLEKFIKEAQAKSAVIDKVSGFQLPTDVYDPLQEKTKFLESTMQTLIDNGINPASTALGDLYGKLVSTGDAMADRESAASELQQKRDADAQAAFEAQFGSYEKVQQKVYKFGEKVEMVTDSLDKMTGPIAEVAQKASGLIKGFTSLAGMGETFKKISFTKSDTNPLGAAGGAMGAVGAVGAMFGIVQSLAGILDAPAQAAAAESQKKAAEAWMKFMNTASITDMFGKREELEALLKSYQGTIAEWWFGTTFTAQLTELIQKVKQILGTSTGQLIDNVKSAFSAQTIDEFTQKFGTSMKETTRNALIAGFLEGSVMKPLFNQLSDALTNSVADGKITAQEKAINEGIQQQILDRSVSFFGVLDAMGLGMKDLTEATSAATASMRNLPSGFRYQTNQFALQNPDYSYLPHMAIGGSVGARPGGTAVVLGDGGETEYVVPESKMGGTVVNITIQSGSVIGVDNFKQLVTNTVQEAQRRNSMAIAGVR